MTDQVQQEPSVSDRVMPIAFGESRETEKTFLQFSGDRKNYRQFIEVDKQAGESGAAEDSDAADSLRQHRAAERAEAGVRDLRQFGALDSILG